MASKEQEGLLALAVVLSSMKAVEARTEAPWTGRMIGSRVGLSKVCRLLGGTWWGIGVRRWAVEASKRSSMCAETTVQLPY